MKPRQNPELGKWATAISRWLAFPDEDDETDAAMECFNAYMRALRDFIENAVAAGGVRDTWEPFISGSTVILRSNKLSHDFSIGIDLRTRRLLISTSLLYAQHLSKMTDDFWRTILELHDQGRFTFSSNRTPDNPKSIVWAVMDEHDALAAEAAQAPGADPFLDAGTLEISWPLAAALGPTYASAVEALRRLYRVNYLLYRHEYILRAARKKNARQS